MSSCSRKEKLNRLINSFDEAEIKEMVKTLEW